MLNIYLAVTAISLFTEAYFIKKGIDQAKEDGYVVNKKSNIDTVRKQLMHLAIGLPFVPILNIALPIALVVDYKSTYKNIVKDLKDNGYIKKEEVVVTKPKEEKVETAKDENNKSYAERSTKEKISYFEKLREELLHENDENTNVKTYKKNK